MTNEEFDKERFGADDEISVKKYYFRGRESIEYINFNLRIINGYRASEIIEIIHKNLDHETERLG